MFILPSDVIDDPEHKEVLSQLGECKFADIEVFDEKDEKLLVFSVKEISPVSIKVEKEMTVKPVYEKVIKQK